MSEMRSAHGRAAASRWIAAAAFGLAIVLVPAGAQAQDWRTVTSARQYSSEETVRVKVSYGAGELRIRPGTEGSLYQSSLRYNADVFRPVASYRNGVLELGVEGGRNVRLPKNNSNARLDLQLGPDAPMDMKLEFGAVEADIELGGLRIQALDVSTGASETTLRFSEANPEVLTRLNIEAGAAAFRAAGLGNANAQALEFSGGVGDVHLDFTGDWQRDLNARIEIGLGSLTLVLPEDIGVRVSKETFLMSFDSEGLMKRGDAYYSANWESARYKLMLDVEGALGSIDVRWAGSAAGSSRTR